MTLRDDIRNHFAREEDRLPTPAGLRASVSAEASRAEVAERRTVRWATAVALLLAVAIVAGLLAANGLRQSRVTPVVPGHTPAPTAKLAHGNVLDAEAYDGSTGWALLEACDSTKCRYSVEVTTDGGASWSAPFRVGPDYSASDGDAPRHIHFETATDGFVYGHAGGFATHDGGRTWARIAFQISEVVAIVGRFQSWAVTYPCAKSSIGTQCAYEVHLSVDQGRTWTAAAPLPGGFVPSSAIAIPKSGILLTSFGTGDMLTTTQGADSWTAIHGQCSPDTFENYVATSDGAEVWQLCGGEPPLPSPPPNPPAEKLVVSSDYGLHWTRRTGPPGITVGATLVSPMRGVAIITSLDSPIELTRDGGRTWKPVTTASGFREVQMAPSYGWAVDTQGVIWASADGGLTWRPLTAQP